MSAEQIIENLRAVESMAGSLASQMETNLRMNRWREHLGDDPLDGFGGRGPAEYHYMATHEPEGPGLTRFGNRGFRPAPPRGEGADLAARLEARADNADKMAAEVARNPSNYGESGPRHHARLLAAAYAFRKAAEMARASTHPEQGEARVLREGEIADHAAAGGRLLYDCPQHGLIEDGWVGSFRCEDDNEGDIMYCTLCPASREWAKDELKGPFAFPPAQTEQGGEAS